MSNFPTIPDFTDEPASLSQALRAVKDIVEQLAGLRQGGSLSAPQMFIQDNEPMSTGRLLLKDADMWFTPQSLRMKIRSAGQWVEIKAVP